jgi:hypothetical protein
MIPQPPHKRKLGLLGTSLTKARLHRDSGSALDAVRDDIERVLIETGYLDGAPFSWVSLAIRYGLKDEAAPHYQRINQKYGDLPLAIEVDTHRLVGATRTQLEKVFRVAVLRALVHAAEKYQRPAERLRAKLVESEKEEKR